MVSFSSRISPRTVDGDFAGEVAVRYGGGDFGDVADLRCQVAGHGVDGVREIFPGAADSGDVGFAAEQAFGTDFAGYARYFGGEGAELIDHGVDGVLQLQNFTACVDGDARARDRRWLRLWLLRRCCGLYQSVKRGDAAIGCTPDGGVLGTGLDVVLRGDG